MEIAETPIIFLEPESREEARSVAKKVWVKSMELLNRKNLVIMEDCQPKDFESIILQQRGGIDRTEKSIRGQNIDLLIGRIKPEKQTDERLIIAEKVEFLFYPGMVLKRENKFSLRHQGAGKPPELVKKEIKTSEADKDDLENLLDALNKSAKHVHPRGGAS